MKEKIAPLIAQKVQASVEQVRPKQLVQSKIEFKGRMAKYEVDLEAGSLFARSPVFEMLLTKEEVEQLVWELVEAYGVMPRSVEAVGDGTEPQPENR